MKINKLYIASLALMATISFAGAQNIDLNSSLDANLNTGNTQPKATLNNKASVKSDANLKESDNSEKESLNENDSSSEETDTTWGKIDKADLKLYVGKTKDEGLNTKIKDLRAEYVIKIDALRKQYLVDIKNLVDTNKLTVSNNTNNSANANVESETKGDNGKGIGFWNRIKAWFGMNK